MTFPDFALDLASPIVFGPSSREAHGANPTTWLPLPQDSGDGAGRTESAEEEKNVHLLNRALENVNLHLRTGWQRIFPCGGIWAPPSLSWL